MNLLHLEKQTDGCELIIPISNINYIERNGVNINIHTRYSETPVTIVAESDKASDEIMEFYYKSLKMAGEH